MILKGNEMTIHRNETFTIDFNVVNKDGSPFIVSSEYSNPYVLITVASTKYNQKDRYVSNWWLNLDNQPRFFSTVIKTITGDDDASIEGDAEYEYVYYNKSNGQYLYAKYDDEGSFVLYPYEFRIIHSFPNRVTKEWVEQSYVYSIYLVSGESTTEYLKDLYTNVFGEEPNSELNNEEIYKLIYAKEPSVVENINYSRPIVNYDVVQIILEPTKLTVLSDPHGDLTTKINEINHIL